MVSTAPVTASAASEAFTFNVAGAKTSAPNTQIQINGFSMFAAHALAGMLPAPKVPGVLPMNVDGTARMAYAYADAMLAGALAAAEAARTRAAVTELAC